MPFFSWRNGFFIAHFALILFLDDSQSFLMSCYVITRFYWKFIYTLIELNRLYKNYNQLSMSLFSNFQASFGHNEVKR